MCDQPGLPIAGGKKTRRQLDLSKQLAVGPALEPQKENVYNVWKLGHVKFRTHVACDRLDNI